VSNHRQPSIRIRVLRWLLVLAVLAGTGVLQGRDCFSPTLRGTTMTAVSASGSHLSTAESAEPSGYAHRHHADSSGLRHTHTTADDCHLQPAPTTAATITSSTLSPPTTEIRVTPVEAPVLVRRPRLPVAVTLTEIGISRI
jgi:hypothetical protein